MSSGLTCWVPEAGRHHNYSRKQKSLGLLCTNFLSLYNREGVDVIGLDEAASILGVERRRIYDIVNVLESVGVLTRKAKNKYTWKGFGAIPVALKVLKENNLKDNNRIAPGQSGSFVKISDEDNEDDENEDDTYQMGSSQNDKAASTSSITPKQDHNRKEKSLGLLTQNFVKLFLHSNAEVISLDDAAKQLLGDSQPSSVMRTKVRRIYDIANVLSSLKLIEKTHASDSRKPAFRWLGYNGKIEETCEVEQTRKRAFGAEITNVGSRQAKPEEAVKRQKKTSGKDESKSYEFGPFAPLNVSKTERRVSIVRNWENIASMFQPQYQNHALKELFTHYLEAWQSWHSEVGGTKSIHQST